MTGSESFQIGLAVGVVFGLAIGWLLWALPWMVRVRQDRHMAEVRRISAGWGETAQMPVLARSHRRTPWWRSGRFWRPLAFWVSTPPVLFVSALVLVLFMLVSATWIGTTALGGRLAAAFKWLATPHKRRQVHRPKRTYTVESLRG